MYFVIKPLQCSQVRMRKINIQRLRNRNHVYSNWANRVQRGIFGCS